MKIFIYIAILLVSFFSNSQQRFNRVYADSSDDFLASTAVLELSDGIYIAIGQKTTTEGRGVVLYKINQNGDTLVYREHFFATECLYTAKAIIRTNDFLVIGSRITGCDDINDDNSNDMSLMSFDFNLNLNWIKTYGGNYFDAGRDLFQNEDGSLMLCGTKSPSSANMENFYLVKTDENGNVLWERTYGGNNIDKATSIIKSHDNGYLISGVSNSFSPIYKVLVYALDENGNELWHQMYGGTINAFAGFSASLPDKSYLLYKTENSFPNYVAELSKIDSNGKLIWTKNYAETTLSALDLSKPLSLQDGTMIVTGGIYNSNNWVIARILKLDPMGNIIWNRKYEVLPNRSHYIYDIKQTLDDGFVFSGFAYDTLTPNRQRFWVAKLDCFGCDGVLCDFGTSCDVYDCTGKDFSANFTVSTDTVFTNNNQPVIFTNSATETSNREWIFPDTTIYTSGTVNYQFNQVGTYNVQLITYHGACSDTSMQTIVVTSPLGYEELDMEELFKVYPNPVNDKIHVKSSYLISKVEIFDIFGRLLASKEINNLETDMDVNSFAKGEYLIQALTKEGVLVRRMVKL